MSEESSKGLGEGQDIGILERRRIEAELLKPLMEAFSAEVGPTRTRAIVINVVKQLARAQGARMAQQAGGNTLRHFAGLKEPWVRGGALEFDVSAQEDDRYDYNVTRCKYAEMYRELGLEEMGFHLSCDRDGTLIEGFNPEMELRRTQTIMQGAPFCDFRYRPRSAPEE